MASQHADQAYAGKEHTIKASGGPAGGQTFEKFDKQVLKTIRLFHRCWQAIWFWF